VFDQRDGQKVTDTQWHHLSFYGPLVDVVEKQLQTGTHIFVQGQLKNQAWQDKDGQQRTSTQIVVSELRCLNNKATTTPVEPAETAH